MIGKAGGFARRQPALHWAGFWLLFLPTLVINCIIRFVPHPGETDIVNASQANLLIASGVLVVVLTILMVWGECCVLIVGKRLLLSSAGRSRTSFRAVRALGRKLILPVLLTSLLRSAIMVLWTFVFIIPGIIYAIRTVISSVVIVAEGTAYRLALQRSKDMVRGHTWHVLLWLIGISLTLFAPVQVLAIIVEPLANQSVIALTLLAEFCVAAAQTVAGVLFTLCLVVMYGKLKKKT